MKKGKGKVKPGIELFLEKREYKSLKLGFITNHSAITSNGKMSVKNLIEADFNLKSLFGPEHGILGQAQDAIEIEDSEYLGIPVYSLYGKRKSPEPGILNKLDALAFDIQDVGSRYYTYLYTLANSMKVCEELGIRLIVLDRPNPMPQSLIEGHPIEKAFDSFVGAYQLPNIYGLTIGEFASYLKGEFYPDLDIDVIYMENYVSDMSFEDTNLPWVSPSPNIPTPTTALVYGGLCLFEGTNLSEGRGTTRPFETIGAPWIDGENLRDIMASYELPGVVFSVSFFIPAFSKYKAQSCSGVTIHITDKKSFKPVKTGIYLLYTIAREYPSHFQWRKRWDNDELYFIDNLAGTDKLRKEIDSISESQVSPEVIYSNYQEGLEDYKRVSEKYQWY